MVATPNTKTSWSFCDNLINSSNMLLDLILLSVQSTWLHTNIKLKKQTFLVNDWTFWINGHQIVFLFCNIAICLSFNKELGAIFLCRLPNKRVRTSLLTVRAWLFRVQIIIITNSEKKIPRKAQIIFLIKWIAECEILFCDKHHITITMLSKFVHTEILNSLELLTLIQFSLVGFHFLHLCPHFPPDLPPPRRHPSSSSLG